MVATPLFVTEPVSSLPIEARVATYPRLRYMGSKYKLVAELAEVFGALPPGPAVDAFSGSGVVSFALKAMGRQVLANDQLAFATELAIATTENDGVTLTPTDVETIIGSNRDGRDFISRTFSGLYFPDEDHLFLDSAWSHIDALSRYKRALALSALCLAAARKQPRGVFTITDTRARHDDGRRQMRMTLRELFVEAVGQLNAAVFAGQGGPSRATTGDVFDIDPAGVAVAYLDPPYAPPKDDTCYIKRYHFLEGIATYWRGQEIMWDTKTRKLAKRHTPFAYKRSAATALDQTFAHFHESAIVLSYGSNAALAVDELERLLQRHKRLVRRIEVSHRYAFGTHDQATRRVATEYILVGT